MADGRPSFYRRHRWLTWIAFAVVLLLAALAVTAAVLVRRTEPFLRAQIVEKLSQHFHARVELDSFHVSLAEGLQAEGKGLRIWPPANMAGLQYAAAGPGSGGNPLISLDEFRFHTPLRFRLGEPVLLRTVALKGLKIDLPPRVKHAQGAEGKERDAAQVAGNSDPQNAAGAAPPASAAKGKPSWLRFVVQRIDCTDAELKLETNKPGKLPLEFEIASLKLTEITSNVAMKFEAELTNPRPLGLIHTTGHFGPWVSIDPGESQVSGDYTFQHADLATFKGIAGILESTGRYDGTLRNIVVDGDTDTPDFRLTNFGSALPLHTHFHANVDGTNGDTWLEPVDAMLGKSHFTAQGQIVRVAAETGGKLHEGGHDIALNVNVDKARIEDFLKLASKPSSTPILTGDVQVKTTLHIPPGGETVQKRMELDGTFHLGPVQFESASIQDQIRSLSIRGQGHPGDVKATDAASIASQMDGKFTMAGAVVKLSRLTYNVPGAEIDLSGSYAMEGGAINFAGEAKMEATVSEMVGGWKGLLLKPADRFFKKDGAGTLVPIQISGTREKPKFEVDVGRMKFSPQQKAGEKPAEKPPEQPPEAKPE